MPFLHQPGEETPHRGQRPVDRADGLALIPAQAVPEAGHVARRYPADPKRLLVGLDEPGGEFSKVGCEGSPGVRAEIVVRQEAVDERRLLVAGWNGGRKHYRWKNSWDLLQEVSRM